jgi:hypothetical protein
MVHNACRQGAKVDFCCIGSEPVTWPGVAGRFTTVREMLSNIEVEYDATKTC